jgi:hypothetical protein
MHVDRKGTQLVIDLDKKEDALGLFAVLTSNQTSVTPEIWAQGQWLYGWLYSAVQKLAANFPQESSIKTQSAETAASPRTMEVLTSRPLRAKRTRKQ